MGRTALSGRAPQPRLLADCQQKLLGSAAVRGHVAKRGSRWAYVVDVDVDDGVDPVSGKRRQRTKGGFGTEKEADAARRDMPGMVEAGTYVSTTGVTVGEYLAGWIENMRTQVRATTWHGYNSSVKRLTKHIGTVKLQALTPLPVETCYARIQKEGGKRGGPLSPKTVKHVHVVLHRALSDAERLGLVPRNVAHVARSPAVDRREAATWSAEELSAFLHSVEDDRL
jgi:integrase